MMENKSKRGPRRTLQAAAFHSQLAEFKHLLPPRYTELALQIFPNLNADSLRYAVAGRREYWDGMPALRIVAGLDPMPKGIILKPVPRHKPQPIAA